MKTENQNISVVVRCRPLSSTEKKHGNHSVIDTKHDKIVVKERLSHSINKTYTFDKVFGEKSTQIEVYKQVVVPAVDEVLQGYNCTIFAYGQTGTGKTFTMEGERTSNDTTWENDEFAGIVPRAMHQLFSRLESSENCEFSVRASYMEIYNEEIVDLLGADNIENPRLRIYEDKKGSCAVNGLEEAVVANKDQIYRLLRQGAEKRKTACTLMNARSSRSHSVFIVTIHIKENSVNGEELLKIGKLNLVDLAGSECIGKSGAVDKRAREAGNINQSLLTLGRVITALVDHAPHIPYRESKLTRLLQDSLGGKTKTVIIGTVTPSNAHIEETLCTLDYVNRAKNIMNRPELNQRLTKKTLIKEYTEEIERLRKDLQACRDKNGFYISEDNYVAMQGRMENQTDDITEMEDRIKDLKDGLTKMTDLFSDANEELNTKIAELDDLSTDLHDTVVHLKETRKKLLFTRKERDEQRHLVGTHEQSERALFSEAENLLNTAHQTTGHIDALHDKLSRQRSVDDRNLDSRREYATRYEATGDILRKRIDAFREQTSHSTDTAHQLIEEMGKTKEADAIMLNERFEAISDMLTDTSTTYKSNETESLQQNRHLFKELSTQHSGHMKTTEKFVVGELKSIVNEEIVNVKRQVTLMQDKMDTFLKLMDDNEKERNRYVDTFLGIMKNNLTAHETQLEAFVALQTKRVAALHHLQAERESFSSKSRASLLDGFREIFAKEQESLSEFDGKFADQLTAIEKDTVENKLSRKNEVQLCQEYNQTCSNISIKQRVAITEVVSKQNELLNQQALITDDLRDIINNCVTSTNEMINGQENEASNTLASGDVKLQQTSEVNTRTIDDRSEMVQNELRDIKDSSSTAVDFNASCARQTDNVKSTRQHCDQFCDQITGFLVQMCDDLTSHHKDIEQDIASGHTPNKMDYDYPTELTKNRRHSMILSEFRDSYDPLNDSVISKFLVEESDEDASDDVGPGDRKQKKKSDGREDKENAARNRVKTSKTDSTIPGSVSKEKKILKSSN